MVLKNLTFNKRHFQYFALLGLLVFSSVGLASSRYQNAQLHGFLMQSFLKTDRNNFLGSLSDGGGFSYSEIGVNTSVKVSTKFQIAIQLLSRRAGKTDNGDVKLDFALADYRLIDRFDYGLGVRVGRVKNPFGLYNETRDVSFTRESIILPQSIYFERVRDVSLSADGAHLYGHKMSKFGILKAKLVVVRPRVTDDNTEYALLGGLNPGALAGDISSGGQIKFESNDGRFTTAISNVMLQLKYNSTASETGFSNDTDAKIKFYMNIFSVKYNMKDWSFVGEYALRQMKYTGFPQTLIPSILSNATGESYYIQSVYRWNSKIKFIARYDVLFVDKDDKQGRNYEAALKAFGAKNYFRYSKDTMFGIQYNINWHWMARVEIHSINGTAWLPKQENTDLSLINQYWKMVGASISYRF